MQARSDNFCIFIPVGGLTNSDVLSGLIGDPEACEKIGRGKLWMCVESECVGTRVTWNKGRRNL